MDLFSKISSTLKSINSPMDGGGSVRRPRKSIIKCALSSKEAGVVSCRTQLEQVVMLIKTTLSRENLKMFRKSCFGVFLDLPDPVEFRGVLCYLMMVHMCDTNERGAVSFRIRNQEFEFIGEDYFLATGLQFGPPQSLPKTSRMHTITFGGKSELLVDDIRKKYLESLGSGGIGRSVTSLKLAYLMFIYDVLFSSSSFSRRLDMKYIHCVDDEGFMNKYHWGRDSYLYLVNQLYYGYGVLKIHWLVRRKEPLINLYGLCHAFMTFVYERIPQVASMCTESVAGNETAFPRMLRVIVNKKPRFKQMKKSFELGSFLPLTVKNILLPAYEESLLVNVQPFIPKEHEMRESAVEFYERIRLDYSLELRTRKCKHKKIKAQMSPPLIMSCLKRILELTKK